MKTEENMIVESRSSRSSDIASGAGERVAVTRSMSVFKRHRVGIMLFLVPLTLYLVLFSVRRIPSVDIPEFLVHGLLTITVVTAVHLLDRLILFKDTEEYLSGLQEGIELHVDTRIKKLVDDSTSLMKQSLGEIKTGIESDIEGQTQSLVQSSASLQAMARSGIVAVYSTRAEASEDMRRNLVDPGNNTVRIIGISLNDFIRADQEALYRAWDVLEHRISDDRPSGSGHLDIKVLMIDPGCQGAQLRSDSEVRGQEAVPGKLADDVKAVLPKLVRLESKCKARGDANVSFECRLYRLPPILFLCLVDSVCYVEQYHFWSRRTNRTPIPVLKYLKHSEMRGVYPMYEEMKAHFDWIWNNASVEASHYLERFDVGLDKGLAQCGVVNVYVDHHEAYKRINWLLEHAERRVSIQGISLHSFFRPGKLFKAISKLVERGDLDIEVLLLDPDCNQAKYRSYRERLFITPEETFDQYKECPDRHRESDLYQDTRRSIENIRNMVSDITRIKSSDLQWSPRMAVKLYDSAPTCFMLRVDNSLLVEQYHYGKLVPEEDRGHVPVILGKDMPVVEYSSMSPSDDSHFGNPFGLLEDHFAFVFSRQARRIIPDNSPGS